MALTVKKNPECKLAKDFNAEDSESLLNAMEIWGGGVVSHHCFACMTHFSFPNIASASTPTFFDFSCLTSLAFPILSSFIVCPLTLNSILQTKDKFGEHFTCALENMKEDRLTGGGG